MSRCSPRASVEPAQEPEDLERLAEIAVGVLGADLPDVNPAHLALSVGFQKRERVGDVELLRHVLDGVRRDVSGVTEKRAEKSHGAEL